MQDRAWVSCICVQVAIITPRLSFKHYDAAGYPGSGIVCLHVYPPAPR
jgi:hypothetical protein